MLIIEQLEHVHVHVHYNIFMNMIETISIHECTDFTLIAHSGNMAGQIMLAASNVRQGNNYNCMLATSIAFTVNLCQLICHACHCLH